MNCHNPHSPRFKGVTSVMADGKPTVAPTQQYLKPEPRPRSGRRSSVDEPRIAPWRNPATDEWR